MNARKPIKWGKLTADVATVLFALFWLVPLIFSILVSFRPAAEALTQGNIFFGSEITLENYEAAWDISPWITHYQNSLIFVVGTFFVQFFTVTMAGYAFARMRFPLRNILLLIILLQIMVPVSALIAQNFRTVSDLGYYDTYEGMMILYWGSAFGMLLLRQTFRSIPYELEEAARMDGANLFQVLRNIYIPLSIPAYVAFGIVSVSSHWNEFLWPLIITSSEDVRPVTLGLSKLVQSAEVGALYHQQMAGTIIVIAPLTILFMIFQRRFIESFAQSGIK